MKNTFPICAIAVLANTLLISCKEDYQESNTEIQIEAGAGGHGLILKADNTLWATGKISSGQLGDGTNINRKGPVKIMENVKAISAGAYHSLILKIDNRLWETGGNSYDQLGDGSFQNRNLFVAVYLP